MLCFYLAIYELEAIGSERAHPTDEGKLAGIADVAEHAFAEEYFTQTNAI